MLSLEQIARLQAASIDVAQDALLLADKVRQRLPPMMPRSVHATHLPLEDRRTPQTDVSCDRQVEGNPEQELPMTHSALSAPVSNSTLSSREKMEIEELYDLWRQDECNLL